MNRTVAAIGAAIIIAMCLVPLMPADSSEADSGGDSYRMSSYYLYRATVTLDPGDYVDLYMGSYWCVSEGSVNDAAMDAHIRDPTDQSIRFTQDDQEEIHGLVEETTTVHIYCHGGSSLYNPTVYYCGHIGYWEMVMEPYNTDDLTYFVKSGDTFDLRMTVLDNEGRTASFNVLNGYDSTHVDDGRFTLTPSSSTMVTVEFENSVNDLYYDVTYEASGFSSPNGSPMVYVAICAVVTVAILALLVYAGMRPKWSK